MRSTSWLLGLGFATLTSAACTSDADPTVYVALSYQVRCLTCQPRVPDENAHEIKAVNGEGGLQLECRVNRIGGTRRVSFSSTHPKGDDTYSLSVTNGNIDGDESEGPCQVDLTESGNSYSGACGSDDPTEDRPCKISFEERNGVIKGGVYCLNIPNVGNRTSTRTLVSPATRDEPATFEVHGCKGL